MALRLWLSTEDGQRSFGEITRESERSTKDGKARLKILGPVIVVVERSLNRILTLLEGESSAKKL